MDGQYLPIISMPIGAPGKFFIHHYAGLMHGKMGDIIPWLIYIKLPINMFGENIYATIECTRSKG